MTIPNPTDPKPLQFPLEVHHSNSGKASTRWVSIGKGDRWFFTSPRVPKSDPERYQEYKYLAALLVRRVNQGPAFDAMVLMLSHVLPMLEHCGYGGPNTATENKHIMAIRAALNLAQQHR